MIPRTLPAFFLGLLGACAALGANAGEVNEAGGLAIKGYDPVAYFREGVPAKGLADLRLPYKGVTYLFKTPANRDAFRATPDKFLPEYGGFCAYGVANGYKADIDPAAFTLVGGKLYLNYNAQVKADWQKDTMGHIRRADDRWPQVRPQAKVVK
jgi:YHS domain-containing protein